MFRNNQSNVREHLSLTLYTGLWVTTDSLSHLIDIVCKKNGMKMAQRFPPRVKRESLILKSADRKLDQNNGTVSERALWHCLLLTDTVNTISILYSRHLSYIILVFIQQRLQCNFLNDLTTFRYLWYLQMVQLTELKSLKLSTLTIGNGVC